LQSDFRVETHTTGRVTTLAVLGELDLVSSPALQQELDRAIGSDAEVIVLDLRRLSFMDSTGLHVVVKAHQRVQEGGRRFVLTRGSEQVQRLLDLTGVAELMRIVDSPADALEADRAPDTP
jgi:anti-sigma B factor antagonist